MNENVLKVRMLTVLLAIALPGIAVAQDTGKYQCSHGELLRRVEIVTEPGAEVPCGVHYYKDTEMPGQQQILWTAENDASYCARKASELVTKLEGWGWDCGQSVESGVDEEVVEELLGETDTPEMADEPE